MIRETMNVYDFDDTIYRGDSTIDFILYSYRRYPMAALKSLPKQFMRGVGYFLKRNGKEEFKEVQFSVIKEIEDIDAYMDAFVDSHIHKIKKWYLDQQKEDDVIISASPYFLVNAFCKRIGIQHVMATNLDPKTSVCHGNNCHDFEKVNRFYEAYPDGVIDEFYSDSYSDTPLADIAKQAFLVKGDERKSWR